MRTSAYKYILLITLGLSGCGQPPEAGLDIGQKASEIAVAPTGYMYIGNVVNTASPYHASPSFPDPFIADQIIAIYDRNQDQSIAAVAQGGHTFPASLNEVDNRGSRIGSSWVQDGADGTPAGPGFCGDIFVLGLKESTTGGANPVFWFALRSPSYVPPVGRECFGVPGDDMRTNGHFDAGAIGDMVDGNSITGLFHSTYIGGFSNASMSPPTFDVNIQVGDLTPERPGLVEVSGIESLVLHQVRGGFDAHVRLEDVRFRVPLIADDVWDGVSGFPTIQHSTIDQLRVNSNLGLHTTGAEEPERDEAFFPDVTGDGLTDMCYREGNQIICAEGLGTRLGPIRRMSMPYQWSNAFPEASSRAYSDYMRFVDLDGDGDDDVCHVRFGGIYCARSNGLRFETPTRWSSAMTGPSFFTGNINAHVLNFPDIDGNGSPDLCIVPSYPYVGVRCYANAGSSFSATPTFTAFSDSKYAAAKYASTIRLGDIDRDGRADACIRDPEGILCARNRPGFVMYGWWLRNMTDRYGWDKEEYYSTIQLVDINGDRAADLCGRGSAGLYCATSSGRSHTYGSQYGFRGLTLVVDDFRDPWWADVRHYSKFFYLDYNGDGRTDICARGDAGILCARQMPGFTVVPKFEEPRVESCHGDLRNYWGYDPNQDSLYRFVQPAQADNDPYPEFIGFNDLGVRICDGYAAPLVPVGP